ncbi:MAG: FecR domain-containing protein [Sphingobium sp.]
MRHPSPHEMNAAHWAWVLRNDEADSEEINRALDWIAQSPAHRMAFERAERFLQACDAVEEQDVAGLMDDAPEPFRKEWPVWRMAAAAAFCLLMTGAVLHAFFPAFFGGGQVPAASQNYATEAGQFRTVSLADGSIIALSGASEVLVSYSPTGRYIELLRGEALFEVAKDRRRPFVVKAGEGSATALGTAFNIDRTDQAVTITVVHGVVAADAKGRYSGSQARLEPTMQVTYYNDGVMSPIRRVDVDTVLSWRKGTLVFSGQPLSQVIEDVNRYSRQPIVIEDRELDFIPITGAIRVDGIREWLTGLERLSNIRVVVEENRLILRKKGNFPLKTI